MEVHLKIIGILLIGLSLLHVGFPRYFNWRSELPALSLINREMFVVHGVFIALTIVLMGTICLTSAHELVSTVLGRRLAFGLGVFWTVRLAAQFFGYSAALWRGKPFETTVHVLFTCMWSYFAAVFFLVTWG